MSEDLGDHRGIFNGSNDLQGATEMGWQSSSENLEYFAELKILDRIYKIGRISFTKTHEKIGFPRMFIVLEV